MPFLAARGSRFFLGDVPVYLTGANCYYLTYKSRVMVDALIAAAADTGLNVIRTWGFLDIGSLDGTVVSSEPPGPKEGVYFQSWDPTAGRVAYNDGPDGLERLDYVVHAASERGLKLILPLVNNWREFGGKPQYAAWYGATEDDFYAERRMREAYRDWAAHLLNRTNLFSGLQYKDDPAIAAWELINEGRSPHGIENWLNWVREMSAHIKSIDSMHLLAVGDEGFFNFPENADWTLNGSQGTDFEATLAINEIDFGTYHLYPEAWQKDVDFGPAWIEEHGDAAFRANKPVIFEEYGLRDKSVRDDIYGEWLDVNDSVAAGDLFWMLADRTDDGTLYPDYDQFTLYKDSLPASIRSHIARVNERNLQRAQHFSVGEADVSREDAID